MDDFASKCDFETEFHNSSSVWGKVLAVAARKIFLLGNLIVMAEGNNPSVPKKKRPTDRGPQFSFNIEVPRTQESRLLGIKDRIKMARGSLNLTKATTSTQNADLMEALLLAFEEKIERKRLTSSDLSLSSTGSPNPSLLSTPSTTARFSIPSASSTPSSRISLPFSDPFSPISLPQAERTPQRMQITASSAENDSIYLCSEESLRTLFSFFCNTLSTSCCYCGKPLDCESLVFNRQSHVVSVTISCVGGDSFKWLSSPIMGGSPPKYYVNLRLIHGVLSCGLTETQYISFCQAANIGSEGEKTFDTVLKKLGYLTVVKRVSNESMLAAQEQVKSNPAYAVNGECVITDARHDSSRSAAHTTVSALSFSTKKVLAVVNWSKANETSAVSREVPMTKELLTYLCETQGFHVAEVAHDFVLQLKTWILSKGMLNSFDSLHGAKSVTKAMKKVASGPQRDEGSKWFFELSDKVKSTRTHVYFCMKNSPPTEEEFQGTLLNVVDHYQGNHVRCHAESQCKQNGYVMSKRLLTKPEAVAAYRKAIMSTSIYRHALDYMRCRETYWIESLHSVMLIYAAKRIHYEDDSYNMRMELAILDWNENVNREASSLQMYQHARHPNRLAETRVLTSKTFHFRETIWSTFFNINK